MTLECFGGDANGGNAIGLDGHGCLSSWKAMLIGPACLILLKVAPSFARTGVFDIVEDGTKFWQSMSIAP